MKRALIVGSSGQDGRILFEERSRSCAVLGVDVGSIRTHAFDPAPLAGQVDIHDPAAMNALVERFAPDELYYLAARHHSSEERPDDASELRESTRVNFLALVNVLDAVRARAPSCRVFYAGSSHMFGSPASPRQDESTPFSPENPYAITKVAGAHACALYRARHGIHVSVGILYNHESPLRGARFVSQRIARGARQAERDPSFKLALGSLSATVDWGYAPDFVDAMVRIVAQPDPADYVVATGEPHTVGEFVEVAFRALGLDWREHVEEDRGRVRSPANALVGDASKLRARTGWRPTVSFEEMVGILVTAASATEPRA
ncbi:MAG: GDP-mannose 4,6-dehydratase [Candidatus Lutacidiplasmatales archaeon]